MRYVSKEDRAVSIVSYHRATVFGSAWRNQDIGASVDQRAARKE